MSVKTFNTRILQKTDTISALTPSSGAIVPLRGEIVIGTETQQNLNTSPFVMKVGDGVNSWAGLPPIGPYTFTGYAAATSNPDRDGNQVIQITIPQDKRTYSKYSFSDLSPDDTEFTVAVIGGNYALTEHYLLLDNSTSDKERLFNGITISGVDETRIFVQKEWVPAHDIMEMKISFFVIDGNIHATVTTKSGIVSGGTIYDGTNVMLRREQLGKNEVCLVFKDTVDNCLKFMPYDTLDYDTLDKTRYQVKPVVRFTQSAGRDVLIHPTVVPGRIWAEWNRYKLECITSSAGGFHWAVTINGTAKSGDVSWAAGDTLDSIVTQLNTGAVPTYLIFSHESGENFIRIRKGGYNNSTFTITDNTGANLIDLSKYTQINGVQQAETHRDWQSQDVVTLFPNSGFLPANTVQYAKNGYNLSYWCGGNLTRYKQYNNASGTSTFRPENEIGSRMTQACFNSLNGDGVASHQQLYDKYQGSWDAYMEASMVQINDSHTNGIEYQSYNDGDVQTAFLDSVTTMDFDGNYIKAYPSAAAARSFAVITDIGSPFNLPTQHELAVFMEDEKLAKINAAFDLLKVKFEINTGSNPITVNPLSYASGVYYWSVARYSSNDAWLYDGDGGTLGGYTLSYGLSSRALAYLN